MRPVNRVGFETRWGYRTLELFHGDITAIDRDVDIIAVSAFSRGYELLPGSVMEALKTALGIDVGTLAKNPGLDLRDTFGCWISAPLQVRHVGRLLCVETRWMGHGTESAVLQQSIRNLFVMLSILEAQDDRVRSIAMPVLGAGYQQFAAEDVVRFLMDHAQRYLRKSEFLRQVLFIECHENKVKVLDKAMDIVLGRINIEDKDDSVIGGMRGDILRALQELEKLKELKGRELIEELRILCLEDRLRSSQWGVAGRRLVERIVNHLIGCSEGQNKLSTQIEALSQNGACPLVRRYMHLLRAFGNESVHERESTSPAYSEIGRSDLVVLLACILRTLEFWISIKDRQMKGDNDVPVLTQSI